MPIAKVFIKNESGGQNHEVLFLEIYDTFLKRLKGLMFMNLISQNGGAFFINKTESLVDSSIHMLFMNFDIAVFWLDKDNYVVDKVLAKKWHPFYAPKHPAKTIIETHYNNFEKFHIGDLLQIEIS